LSKLSCESRRNRTAAALFAAALPTAALAGCVADLEPEEPAEAGESAAELTGALGTHVIDDVLVRPMLRDTVFLTASSAPHVIRTTDLKQLGTGVPDPVMIVQGPGQQWTNDDCGDGSRNACVTIPGSLTQVVVTVFGRFPQSFGTFDLVADGALKASDAQFGGTLLRLGVPLDGGMYAMQTVAQPGGATDPLLFLLRSDFQYGTMNTDSGIGADAKIKAEPAANDWLLVASASLANLGTTSKTRVIINACLDEDTDCDGATQGRAAGGDPDHDWLSNAVEGALGTNPNDRDTDDDGILDYYEVIGHRVGSAEEPLPLRGADPRHADLFTEMDTSFTTDENNNPIVSNRPLDDSIMVPLRDMFNDLPSWSNPDGTKGIHVHADGGTCSDPTLCGNWGGQEHYEHVCDTPSLDTARGHLGAARRGIYRYTLRTCRGAQTLDTGTAIHRIGNDNDAHNAEVWAHEMGHGFGLDHWGKPVTGRNQVNSSPAYPSTMNYAYQNRLGPSDRARFSEGRMSPIAPSNQLESNYSPGVDKTYLTGEPYFHILAGDSVDFDHDGRINSQAIMFDAGPTGQRSGQWPDVLDLREADTRKPTGGIGVAVRPINATKSRFFVVAPYQHGDGIYPEISWIDETIGQTPSGFASWKKAKPLPGGALANGEVAADLTTGDQGISIFVTMPNAAGQLLYAYFLLSNETWTDWSPIPNWPAGTRARQASAVQAGKLTVLYRDIDAADDVPNVHMARLTETGWTDWEVLNVPSFLTPGLALAPDLKLYLLTIERFVDGGVVKLRPKLSQRGYFNVGAFTGVDQLKWPKAGLTTDIPTSERTRLELVPVRYKLAGGGNLPDDSIYLAAYWITRAKTPPNQMEQRSWTVRRAYTPGRITSDGACFGQTVDGLHGCADSADVRVRYQEDVDRPWAKFSLAAAVRHGVVSAAYVGSTWDDNDDGGFTPQIKPITYQPWANGVMFDHVILRDTNDAAIMRQNACTSLYKLEPSKACRCSGGC